MRILRFLSVALLLFLGFSSTAQDENKTLLWKITGKGLDAPSYLYGTMHVYDDRAFQFGDSVLPALESCKAYAMEVKLDEESMSDLSWAMDLVGEFMMDGDTTLSELLTRAEYNMVDERLQENLGFSLDMFETFKPVYLLTILGENNYGTEQELFLDMYLSELAKDKGLRVFGLETMEEQIAAFNSGSNVAQAQMLVEYMKMEEEPEDEMDKLMEYYLAGDLDALFAMNEEYKMPPSMMKAFITNRNALMAERLVPIIRIQPTFIAVGALHLPGEVGLIHLLRQRGYAVTPIKS